MELADCFGEKDIQRRFFTDTTLFRSFSNSIATPRSSGTSPTTLLWNNFDEALKGDVIAFVDQDIVGDLLHRPDEIAQIIERR